MLVFMIPVTVDSWNMSIDLDYFSSGKSEENQFLLGISGGFRLG